MSWSWGGAAAGAAAGAGAGPIGLGLGAVAGGFLGGSAESGQSDANISEQNFNASEAAKQRAWEERMFGSRYQITRKDLEAAGYNPLMALGLNPSIPAGASASAHPKSTTEHATSLISQNALTAASIMKLRADTDLSSANAAAVRASIPTKGANIPGTNINLQTAWQAFKSKAGQFGSAAGGAAKAGAGYLDARARFELQKLKKRLASEYTF